MDSTKTTRSDSVSSISSTASTASSPPMAPNVTRRGSNLFASLHENKRPNDPRIQARRASLHEQRPTPGFIGRMWSNWVYGPTS